MLGESDSIMPLSVMSVGCIEEPTEFKTGEATGMAQGPPACYPQREDSPQMDMFIDAA